MKLLSVEQIRSRLDDRFRLLTGGKNALPRQQTLQAAIQWSYDQLAADEQRLLRVLSVFVGGWTLEIATRVFEDDGDEFAVLDLLSRLVDKSLVLVTRRADGDTRYTLLETVRQYAAGAPDRQRRRPPSSGGVTPMRSSRSRSAPTRSGSPRKPVGGAARHRARQRPRGARVVPRQRPREVPRAGRSARLVLARAFVPARGTRAPDPGARGGAGRRPARKARARALWGGAYLHALRGDTATSTPMMAAALQMWREVGAIAEVAEALEGVGWAQFLAGDDDQAYASFEESLRLQREAGDPHLVNRAKVALGQALVALGRVEEARALAAEIIAFSHDHGNLRAEHSGWHYTADCALLEDNHADALGLYQTSLTLARQTGDRLEIGFEVQGVAMSLAGLGQPDLALRLGGAVEAEHERIGSDHARPLLGRAADEAPRRGTRDARPGRCRPRLGRGTGLAVRRGSGTGAPGGGDALIDACLEAGVRLGRRCRLDAPSSARPAS